MTNGAQKPIILIIERHQHTDNIFDQLADSYTVIHSENSHEGYDLAKKVNPSLIILESSLSPIGGYELCKKFKTDTSLSRIPIIFNIGRSEQFDPCFILELGAIDYLVHPTDIKIVRAKVQNFVNLYHSFMELEKQVSLARELNPNTALPGNTSIVNHIYAALSHDQPLTLVYTDLDYFKSYNDTYGFGKGDQVIQLTANVLQDAIRHIDGFTFLGHIGGDDFVFIASTDHIDAITSHIIQTFDTKIKEFYKEKDRNQGYVISRSRQGQLIKHPLVAISMGGVDLEYFPTDTRFEEISDICTEVKCVAKSKEGSVYFRDRRGKDNLVAFREKAN